MTDDERKIAEAKKLFPCWGPPECVPGLPICDMCSSQNAFRAGWCLRNEHIAKHPKVRALIGSAKDISSWLERMATLKWDDPKYAPNFKQSANELREAIKAFDDTLKTKPESE